MKPKIVEIRKQDGRLTEISRKHLKELFDNLRDGAHEIHLFANLQRAYKSRYRYYFAYMLPELITRLNIMIVEHKTGEERFITTGELHTNLKKHYNGGSLIDFITGKISIIPLSTTQLDDNEFISEYEDQILSDLMNAKPEAFQDFLTREEWIEAMKKKYDMRDKIQQ